MMLKNQKIILGVAAALLLVAGGGLVNLFAQAKGVAKPATVAVVDVQEVMKNLKQRQQILAEITQKVEKLQKWQQGKQDWVKQRQADLDLIDPNSASSKKMRNEIARTVIEVQVELKYRQRELEMEKALQLERMYRQCMDVTARLATQNGYDLVLQFEKLPPRLGITQQQVAAVVSLRKVLYSNATLNITGQVTVRMNNEFDNK